MGRSILAVVGGLVAMVICVIVGTVVATLAFVPGNLRAMSTPPRGTPLPASYLTASLVVSLGGAMLGGWVVTRLAARRPFAHAVVLAGVVLLMSLPELFHASAPPSGQPDWYRLVLPVLGIAGVLIGGWLGTPRRR